jgi:hypothetical protein
MNVGVHLDPDGRGVSYEWESYEDFLPDLAKIKEKRPAVFKGTLECGGARDPERWFGCKSFYDVQHKTAYGWPELRERCIKMLNGIELDLPLFPTMSQVRRRKRIRDEQGDALDIGRVWNGQLDTAWERPVRTERNAMNTKRITVAFDVTANAYVSNDMAMWRAALCTLLVDSLARAGRVFEIWVVDSTASPFTWGSHMPMKLWSAWCVKRTGDPLLLDRVCAMVSVGFMRTAGFMAMGAGTWSPSTGFGAAMNYGLPMTLRKRQESGEVVLRIGECYDRRSVINEYKRAWEEVERQHAGDQHAQCVG